MSAVTAADIIATVRAMRENDELDGAVADRVADFLRQHAGAVAVVDELRDALEASLTGLAAASGNRCADMAARNARAVLAKAGGAHG